MYLQKKQMLGFFSLQNFKLRRSDKCNRDVVYMDIMEIFESNIEN